MGMTGAMVHLHLLGREADMGCQSRLRDQRLHRAKAWSEQGDLESLQGDMLGDQRVVTWGQNDSQNDLSHLWMEMNMGTVIWDWWEAGQAEIATRSWKSKVKKQDCAQNDGLVKTTSWP